MDYKLICLDMDGTLLNDNRIISEGNIKAIRLAYEKGVRVVVCTGRIFISADFFSEVLRVKSPVIASNGAYIIEKEKGQVVYNSTLGAESCKKLLSAFRKYDIYPHYYTTDMVFTEKLLTSSLFYKEVNKTLPKDKQVKIEIVKDWDEIFNTYGNEILKGIGVDDDIEKIKQIKSHLRSMDEFEVVSSRFNNFEAMNKGVSKGKAVEVLAKFYGISREQIICVGDSENDLSMIEYAGLGVAMGNASGEVKSAAQFITESNNCDGVARVIEKFVLEV